MRHVVSKRPRAQRLALLFALLFALGVVVAACGGDDSTAEPAPAADPAPADPDPAPADPDPAPADPPPAADPPAEAASGEPIIIGRAIALSGGINIYDGPIKNFSEVAAKLINEQGGVLGRPIEFVDFDEASDPAQAGAAAQQAIEAGAEILIPACDFDHAQGAARVAADAGIVSIHCAGGELAGFEGLGALHFNVYPGGTAEGASNAYHALEQGWTTAFLIEDISLEYSKAHCSFFATAYETGGGTIIGRDTFQNSDPSVANQVAAMQQADPDVAVVCSYLPGGAAVMNQIRDVSDVPIETGIAFDGDFWLESVGDISDVYVSTVGAPISEEPNPVRQAAYAAYEELHGEAAPHALSIEGYQIIEILAEAITRAGTTEGVALAAELDKFTEFESLGEKFTYTPTCHRTSRPLTIVGIQNGMLEFDSIPEVPEFPPSPC
jgi:branched-chain amino acid transport system substrate-binding protein